MQRRNTIMSDRRIAASSWILRAVAMAAVLLVPLTPSIAQDTTFSIVRSPSPNVQGNTFNAVTGLSSNDIWAVGFQNDNQLNGSRTLTEHWNGNIWAVIASPNPGSPTRCDGQ